jgi:hypothetical protein
MAGILRLCPKRQNANVKFLKETPKTQNREDSKP